MAVSVDVISVKGRVVDIGGHVVDVGGGVVHVGGRVAPNLDIRVIFISFYFLPNNFHIKWERITIHFII